MTPFLCQALSVIAERLKMHKLLRCMSIHLQQTVLLEKLISWLRCQYFQNYRTNCLLTVIHALTIFPELSTMHGKTLFLIKKHLIDNNVYTLMSLLFTRQILELQKAVYEFKST